MSRRRQRPWRWLVVASLVPAAATGEALCPAAEAPPCVLTLSGDGAPAASPACNTRVWRQHLHFDLPKRFADGDEDGYFETVVELDLAPATGCGGIIVTVAYDAESELYSLDIGDSPTNGGNGGDEGTTRHDAEVHLNAGRALVYASDGLLNKAERLAAVELPSLTGRVLQFRLRDQELSLSAVDPDDGRLFAITLRSQTDQRLFALAGQDSTRVADAADHRVHAAFNRVIHRRDGAPAGNRYGSGVRRVELRLER